jgi:high affinity sulfate transporter 1
MNGGGSTSAKLAFRLRAVLPPTEWLARYRPEWLASDAAAGLTLAAYGIPVALAYASLAGVPAERGVYGYLAGGVAYALFGSSRQLAIGPTSAISMLVGATVAGMAGSVAGSAAEIAALTALVVAAVGVLAWLLHLSTLVDFISETILLGFKAGAAITIATTQLPKLFGVPGGGHEFLERVWVLSGQLGDVKLPVLAFGVGALAVLVAGDRLLPGRPVALLVVVASIVLMSFEPLRRLGFATVGELPTGLPAVHAPLLRLSDVDGIVPLALACFLLAYIESVSAARTLAAQAGEEIDPRQELLGLAAANLAVSFVGGFPVAGGLSQSSVNAKAGARTPLALIVASGAIGLCLVFLTGLLRNLPNVVLASIVLLAVKGLIDLRGLRTLWRLSRFEFAIAMVALGGVLIEGILRGVLLAAIVSLLVLLRRASRPHIALLGRIQGTRRYSDLERDPEAIRVPGVFLCRVEASLLYFNAQHVRDTILSLLRGSTTPIRLVVLDLSSTPHVDVSSGHMLASLRDSCAASGAELRLVEARGEVRDLLHNAGLGALAGGTDRRASIDEVVTEFTTSSAAVS